MLRIHLFGHLQVFDNDTLLPPLNPQKTSALLAYLLLRRECAIPRDQVAFTLWADSSESEARSNLRRHLHLLRRALPEPPADRPWLLTEHETLQWNPAADVWLDVQEFEQGIQQDSLPSLRSAAEQYRGDLLENVYEDWALTERGRLRDQYAATLERIAALHESASDLREAITVTKRLLAHDPLREETHRRLMQLHYWAGNRAAALQQYEECKRILREKLNVEPMAETRALSKAMAESQIIPRKHIPTPPPAAHTDSAPAPISPPTPQPARTKPAASRLLTWSALGVLSLVAILLAVRALTQNGPPLETVTFTGPGVAQDTWLTSEFPDSVSDPGFPKSLFKDYSQAHLQYYEAELDRFILRFDLGAMSDEADVESATLSIYFEAWIADAGPNALQRAYPARVEVNRIRQPWQVELASFNFPWSQPGLLPGVDYDASPLDSQLINETGWLTFDIADAVRAWLAHPDDNWGLMLKITDAPEGVAHYWVNTTDHPDAEARPRLTLTYRVNAAP